MSYRWICALMFLAVSFSASAQELFSYDLPISYQRGAGSEVYVKCEVSSRIVDGIRYYLVDLTPATGGWHKYGGSRVTDATISAADRLLYSAEGLTERGQVKQMTEFILDPSTGHVRGVVLRETDVESGKENSSIACLQNVTS